MHGLPFAPFAGDRLCLDGGIDTHFFGFFEAAAQQKP
jgi:hypothetical protein